MQGSGSRTVAGDWFGLHGAGGSACVGRWVARGASRGMDRRVCAQARARRADASERRDALLVCRARRCGRARDATERMAGAQA
jgi:hypothetical protein